MSASKQGFVRVVVGLVAAVIVASGLTAVHAPAPAQAVVGSDFSAGNIISDDLFYDSNAMTQAEIQAFLNAKIGACRNGQCLNVLVAAANSRPRSVSSSTGNLICEAFEGGSLPAAAIIYRAQVACGISAKVILVTLQKEQGLVTNSAPGQAALDRAMGMACPDTAPCAPASLGFANQIYQGTAQLKIYKAARFAKQPGANVMGFHPSAACGSTTLNIENYATAALYNYTPYQPNAAALANLHGTGDSCSSYGNRNFWVFYNSWFGSTLGTSVTSTNATAHVLVRDGAGALWVYQGNSKGGWLVPSQIGTGWGGMVTAFGAGDFDGDGLRDILALDAAGVLWKYPTDGKLTIGTAVEVSSGWSTSDMLFNAGDFNGDGKQDVISRDTNGFLWLHAGTGRGALKPAVRIGNGWNMMDHIFGAGDFNGDGRQDVIARTASGNLWLYPGNGKGGWLAPQQIGYGWTSMNSLSNPGDFNNDGYVDVLARDSAGRMWIYYGNGRGSWLGSALIGSGWGGMASIVGPGPVAKTVVQQPGAGDLNGDGARDVMAEDSVGNLWLYPGNRKGSWLAPHKMAEGWNLTATFGVGDFDGDGLDDALGRDSAGAMWLYPGNGAGGFSNRVLSGWGWGGMTRVFSAGDANGDRFPDVLAVNESGALWLYPGDGAGGWLEARQVGTGWNSMTAVFSAGDFDGDGLPDLLARDAGGNLLLYRGNGTGGWGSVAQIGNGWGSMTDIFSPGDFNGDGTNDVIGRDAAGNLWLYAGNGRGSWLGVTKIGNGWNMMKWLN